MGNLLGTQIGGRYRLERFLGAGGLGQVFLARHESLERRVALKLLHPELSYDRGLVARFEREAKAASKVSHPNSVVIHDFGVDAMGGQRQCYLVMEYLEGQTLHDRIQDHPGRRLPTWEAVHILSQVLRALEAFHQVGVIHRDLKPDNIMLCRGVVGEQVKLLDFGIAKISGMSLTATGQMVGTPHYMAPEQICAKKELLPAVDVYAMGILLYEALTGDPPFMAEHHIDLFRQHLQEAVPSLLQKYPKERHLAPLDGVIQKAMSKKPEDRYQSAEEMRAAMEAALVTSVAQEQEALEVTQARKKLTPSWWLEQPSTTEAGKEDQTLLSLEEESTGDFAVEQAGTIKIPQILVEETIKMERLELSLDWKIEETAAGTVPEVAPRSQAHPSWAQRAKQKIGSLWQSLLK